MLIDFKLYCLHVFGFTHESMAMLNVQTIANSS